METQLSHVSYLTKHQREQMHWRAIEWVYKKHLVVARLHIFKLLHKKLTPVMIICRRNWF